MSEGEFRAELRYRMALSVAETMLERNIISKEEYYDLDKILLQRYRPILGTLLAGNAFIK